MVFGMDSSLYLKLSALMFLEFAVWGAWYPVLAARLLGPLQFSGKQTGWIYSTIPLGSIVMPLVFGQLADRWVSAQYIIAVAHLVGALLLFVAAWKRQFGGLFGIMLLYALCYAGTIPLVNSVMFYHLGLNKVDVAKSAYIFMWAPIAWALAGYFLTGWRWVFRTAQEGRDCLLLASVLSIAMAATSWFVPNTPPAQSAEIPMIKALSLLGNSSFLIFIIITIAAAGMMQFYFLGTAQFMQDNGIAAKNVPASMAVAQAMQAGATLLVLTPLVGNVGYKWTLTIGTLAWLLMYVIYVAPRPAWLIVASQSFHGLAYVFFIIAGQMFGGAVALKGAEASTQALVVTAQSGVGLFLGTQLAGVVMDKCRIGGQFRWRRLWFVPGVIMLACVVALILLFKGTI